MRSLIRSRIDGIIFTMTDGQEALRVLVAAAVFGAFLAPEREDDHDQKRSEREHDEIVLPLHDLTPAVDVLVAHDDVAVLALADPALEGRGLGAAVGDIEALLAANPPPVGVIGVSTG